MFCHITITTSPGRSPEMISNALWSVRLVLFILLKLIITRDTKCSRLLIFFLYPTDVSRTLSSLAVLVSLLLKADSPDDDLSDLNDDNVSVVDLRKERTSIPSKGHSCWKASCPPDNRIPAPPRPGGS